MYVYMKVQQVSLHNQPPHCTMLYMYVYMHGRMLGLLSESDDSCVQKVLADKVVKVDASLELCVVDLTGSTGSVEGVLLTVPHLRLLLERVKEETHLEGRKRYKMLSREDQRYIQISIRHLGGT